MIRNILKRSAHRLLSLVVAMLGSGIATAQIADGYYSSLKGKTGAELKTAIHEIIKNAEVLSYGRGEGATWSGFYKTDRREDNSCIDRYSLETFYFSSETSAPTGMNIEHSFPKSWWGGDENQAYRDLFNLMPSEIDANSAKSNYPMGVVTGTASFDNGAVKVGSSSIGCKVWEPIDKWKGDFSRGMMYMATAYQDLTWKGTGNDKYILEQNNHPTLKAWAYKLYLEWAAADPVDEIEIKRNDAVCSIQGNRNPYVDFPNLMHYVWGDSVGVAFNPETTVKSADYKPGSGNGPGNDKDDLTEVTIYSELLTQSDGGFTVETITKPSADFDVWVRTTSYGWKGTGYYNNTNYASEAILKSQEFDLTAYNSATLNFQHALNHLKGNNANDFISVEVVCDGYATVLSDYTMPSGNSWSFIESGDISLEEFCGSKCVILFRYKSTTACTPTWEINKMTIKGLIPASGIDATVATQPNAFDPTKPFAVYTLTGNKTTLDKARGVILVKQGNKTFKIVK